MNRRGLVSAGFGIAAFAALSQGGVAQVGTPEGGATDPANPFVAGTGLDLVPEGNPNTVEVILQSPLIDTDVVYVIRNTTPQTVTINDVIGTVRDNAGKLLDTVAYAEFGPKTLEPNGVAFGHASFRESSLPLDVVVELVAKASQGVSDDYIPMPIVEVETSSSGFVGGVQNTATAPPSFIEVVGVTLAEDGTPIGYFTGYVDAADQLAPSEVGYFNGYLRGQPSKYYLITANGR